MDPISRRQFWDLIYELSGKGITVFVTTHYMDEAEYCDRLGLVYRGELIADSTPAALKTKHMEEEKTEKIVPSIRDYVKNYGAVEQAIDAREALMALIIPGDFAGRIDSGRPVPVQLLVDGSDSNTATIAMGYAEAVTQTYSLTASVMKMRRIGGLTLHLPVDLRSRVWFNADMESKNYIIPGLIAVIMMVIAALLTSLTIAKEWERGTME